jgi:hypothetical protein
VSVRRPRPAAPDGDRGAALIAVLLIGSLLLALGAVVVDDALGEYGRARHSIARTAAFQAAEAGVDDYLAKLTEDHVYWNHFVHPAEATRTTPGGATVGGGSAWTGDSTWTYTSGSDNWRLLPNGHEYSLRISPPVQGTPAVRIIATGRSVAEPGTMRTIEVLVRSASTADFQMIANRDISYGSTATTRGKIYAGRDENGIKHSISHSGHAYADLFAENKITVAPTYHDGARGYTSSNIRTVIKNPINFNAFTISLVDIARAASNSGGIGLDNPAIAAWKLVFAADGTVAISGCTKVSGKHVAEANPTCGAATTHAVPTIGAIYSAQSVVVSGTVKGAVTVASNGDVVVGGNISYLRPGTDVLGLIAKNEVLVPLWAPSTLTWTAATIAQTGQWRSWSQTQTKGTMTFTGSTATNLGGYMSMYATRVYNYDLNLLYRQPPFFPVLEEAYTVLLFRELGTP